MMSYRFGTTLYLTKRDMLAAIAFDYATAGGNNSPDTVTELIRQGDLAPEQAAAEVISEWGLRIPEEALGDETPVSHMQQYGYTREELEAAFADFVQDRPDVDDDVERAALGIDREG